MTQYETKCRITFYGPGRDQVYYVRLRKDGLAYVLYDENIFYFPRPMADMSQLLPYAYIALSSDARELVFEEEI